ncbi:MAG: hypothetical protein FJZ47_21270 [Candidatus Tectomicrobia bacterium]|uniref:Restriction endonuclease n=1 Tax=Tectimicrobiota bacterium TaxID=2528274 RepID=A0A938B638_UNCTE|nr:hypothetical protein [Candidatus Tectomicrobia bacterium]
MTTLPFEVPFLEIEAHPETYVEAIFAHLESEFLVLPKGIGFVDYPMFETGYEALKQETAAFTNLTPATVLTAVHHAPIALIVVRAMLGFTPPEWAYVTTQRTGVMVSQGFIRTLDRNIRLAPLKPLGTRGTTGERLQALLMTACQLLSEGAPQVDITQLHRLDKADTSSGSDAIRTLAALGVPYAMLLYERFLGRPFAGHRDSVSELVGGGMEAAIEDVLSQAGISYRKTRRAARIPGFDQAPDFIIPSEYNPQVVIEAKITEDDGTARDKVTRVQHLGELSMAGQPPGQPTFEVIACIGGRGFGVRREDMKKLLYATQGKVFTMRTLDRLIGNSRLQEFLPR